jgi:glucokinase
VLGQIKVELELKPVVIELDGVCFAAAELWQGIGSDHDHFGVIVVSTGVGGGFVLDGRVYGGMSGNAGHIGQMGVTLPNTPNSTRRPTLDEEASGPGTVRWAQKSGWTGSSGEDLARDARAGDRRAIDAIYRSASLVGAAAIDVVTLLDLEIVVVGGGFALGSPLYLDAMRTAFQTSSVFHHLANVPIVEATFGTTACLIGAASLVWNTGVLQKSPYSSAMFGGRRR